MHGGVHMIEVDTIQQRWHPIISFHYTLALPSTTTSTIIIIIITTTSTTTIILTTPSTTTTTTATTTTTTATTIFWRKAKTRSIKCFSAAELEV